MAGRISKSEFQKGLSEYATNFRRQIENANFGFDLSDKSKNERVKRSFDDFDFFSRTYFPHYIRQKKDELTDILRDVEASVFHKWVYDNLPRIVKLKISISQVIAAPRGEAKSTYATIFILYCIVYGLKHYILFIQDTFEQAAIMVESIKAELEFNQRLKNDFPSTVGKTGVWKEGVVVTKNNIKIHARGAGQKLRGLKHGAYRPDLAFLDDMENDELVVKVSNRDKLQDWLNKAVENLGEAGAKFDIIYIGTILHHDAVLVRTLNNPLWQAALFKAIIQWPDNMPMWDEWEEILRNESLEKADEFYKHNKFAMEFGAVLSWPDKRDLYYLMKQRVKVGKAAFDAEYQNDPLTAEDAVFRNFTYWKVLNEPVVYFGAVDPSLGKKGANRDPSAILIGGLNRTTMKMKIFEADIKKRVPDKIISDMIYYQEKYHCIIWFVETVQFQEFLRTEIMRRAKEKGLYMPCKAINQNVDKDLRIQSLQPYVDGGDIEFYPNQNVLVEQMKHYPKVDHDDGVDCLHMLWFNSIKYAGSGVSNIHTSTSVSGGYGQKSLRRASLKAYEV